MDEKSDLVVSETAKIRILIVEDDELIRALLDVIISDLGHTIVASVDNAVDALVAYSVHNPHVVISDIEIKGNVDGIELAKKLLQIRKCQILFFSIDFALWIIWCNMMQCESKWLN